MSVIAITNQKGGVGKTTTAVSLSAGLAQQGYKTLLIDTDSQCNSTDTYRAIVEDTATLYDLLFEGEKALDCIQHTRIGDIIPCDPLMDGAEQRFPNDNSRSFILREKCEELKSLYDYIIIDTPPAMGVILSNVFTYAYGIIIPVTCDRYGLAGIDRLCQTISLAQRYTNSDLKILGLVLIKYFERLNICKEISEGLPQVADTLKTKVFKTKIRESVACRESQSARQSIFEYAPTSTTAEDYINLCAELTKGV
jgi:chromosome partitioning protein